MPSSPQPRLPLGVFAVSPGALLRLSEVVALVGLSRSTIYDRLGKGEFPAPIKLGQRCTRWRASTIREWVDSLDEVPA